MAHASDTKQLLEQAHQDAREAYDLARRWVFDVDPFACRHPERLSAHQRELLNRLERADQHLARLRWSTLLTTIPTQSNNIESVAAPCASNPAFGLLETPTS